MASNRKQKIRLYYFEGRNTAVAAPSAKEARRRKRRGGDTIEATRTPTESERAEMHEGRWVRTRKDGKTPGASKYGKGRGKGPKRS